MDRQYDRHLTETDGHMADQHETIIPCHYHVAGHKNRELGPGGRLGIRNYEEIHMAMELLYSPLLYSACLFDLQYREILDTRV